MIPSPGVENLKPVGLPYFAAPPCRSKHISTPPHRASLSNHLMLEQTRFKSGEDIEYTTLFAYWYPGVGIVEPQGTRKRQSYIRWLEIEGWLNKSQVSWCKMKYLICNLVHGTFNPCLWDKEAMGRGCQLFHKNLAKKLSKKQNKKHHRIVTDIRTKTFLEGPEGVKLELGVAWFWAGKMGLDVLGFCPLGMGNRTPDGIGIRFLPFWKYIKMNFNKKFSMKM